MTFAMTKEASGEHGGRNSIVVVKLSNLIFLSSFVEALSVQVAVSCQSGYLA